MASVCSPRRQLAPTVGHEVAHAGIHIRAGILEVAGERTVSALVHRIYDMVFINDIAGCSLLRVEGAEPHTRSTGGGVIMANEQMPWDGLTWGRMDARGFGGGFVIRWDELPDGFLKNLAKARG